MKYINNINTEIEEGRLLIAALAILTTTTFTDKTPNEVLVKIISLSEQIYDK